MKFLILFSFLCLSFYSAVAGWPLNPPPVPVKHLNRDIAALGIGVGQDYGGIGANVTIYPQKNIGLFLGAGYAFAKAGYNTGLRLRLIPRDNFMRVNPYLIGMYGYNAAIKITNLPDYDKLFYGYSAGAGIDIRSKNNKGYFSLGITIPFRDSEVDDYMKYLETHKGVEFKNDLFPVTLSLGYKRNLY